MNPLVKLRLPLFVLVLIMITGTIGYRVMYPVALIDAFYMTVIAISTVGFREVFTLDPEVNTILDPSDRLILVGTADQLEEANRMLLPESSPAVK